jgi:hypothetical protein
MILETNLRAETEQKCFYSWISDLKITLLNAYLETVGIGSKLI